MINTTAKIGLLAAAAAGVVFLSRKAYTTGQLAKRLVIESKISYAGASLFPPQITIKADVTLKNPTQGSIRVNQPMVMIYLSKEDLQANNPLISSDPSSKDFTIPKSDTVKLDPIYLALGGSAALSIGQKLLGSGEVVLWVKKYTLIENTFPIETIEPITLKKAANAS